MARAFARVAGVTEGTLSPTAGTSAPCLFLVLQMYMRPVAAAAPLASAEGLMTLQPMAAPAVEHLSPLDMTTLSAANRELRACSRLAKVDLATEAEVAERVLRLADIVDQHLPHEPQGMAVAPGEAVVPAGAGGEQAPAWAAQLMQQVAALGQQVAAQGTNLDRTEFNTAARIANAAATSPLDTLRELMNAQGLTPLEHGLWFPPTKKDISELGHPHLTRGRVVALLEFYGLPVAAGTSTAALRANANTLAAFIGAKRG